MRIHTTPIGAVLPLCPEPRLETLRPPVARERIAALVAAGFGRVPVALVARRACVAESTAFAWRSPISPGPRLVDVVCAPRPWAEILLRGSLGLVCPRPALAPHTALGLLLADLGALLVEDDQRPPEALSDEELRQRRERARRIEQTAADLGKTYDQEIARRRPGEDKGVRHG